MQVKDFREPLFLIQSLFCCSIFSWPYDSIKRVSAGLHLSSKPKRIFGFSWQALEYLNHMKNQKAIQRASGKKILKASAGWHSNHFGYYYVFCSIPSFCGNRIQYKIRHCCSTGRCSISHFRQFQSFRLAARIDC